MRRAIGEVPANRQAPIRLRAWCELGLGCVRHGYCSSRFPSASGARSRRRVWPSGREIVADGSDGKTVVLRSFRTLLAPLTFYSANTGVWVGGPAPGRRSPNVRAGCRRAAGAARARRARWPLWTARARIVSRRSAAPSATAPAGSTAPSPPVRRSSVDNSSASARTWVASCSRSDSSWRRRGRSGRSSSRGQVTRRVGPEQFDPGLELAHASREPLVLGLLFADPPQRRVASRR